MKDDLKLIRRKDKIENWRTTKKLGSLLGVTEDINRRKQLATAALNKMNHIWIRKDKIKHVLRHKLYKSIIKPKPLYNSGAWSPTKEEVEQLDAFHRTQLRKVMNVRYLVTLRNSFVCRKSNEEILWLTIFENRWKLFGHTLQLHKDVPAQKSMKFFFTESKAGRFRGRPRINLPQKLNDDLAKYTTRGILINSIPIKLCVSYF